MPHRRNLYGSGVSLRLCPVSRRRLSASRGAPPYLSVDWHIFGRFRKGRCFAKPLSEEDAVRVCARGARAVGPVGRAGARCGIAQFPHRRALVRRTFTHSLQAADVALGALWLAGPIAAHPLEARQSLTCQPLRGNASADSAHPLNVRSTVRPRPSICHFVRVDRRLAASRAGHFCSPPLAIICCRGR